MKIKNFELGPSIDDLFIAFLDLSLSFKNGIPPKVALSSIAERTENRVLKRTFKEITMDLINGEPLATAFGKHKSFPRFCGHVIHVGEESAGLYDCFKSMAYHMKQMGAIRKRIFTAVLPLLIALVIACIALPVLVTVVIPNFVSLFNSQSKALPLTAMYLLKISSFISRYWYLIIPFSGLSMFGIYSYFKHNPEKWDIFLLKIPFYRSIHYNFIQYKFCEIFRILISTGISSIVAVEKSAEAVGNEIMAKMLKRTILSMKEGQPLAQALANNNNSEILDRRIIHLLKSNEMNANAEETLVELSDFYKSIVDSKSQDFGNKISPIFLTIGFLIALYITLTIYDLIFSMVPGV